MKIYKYNSKNKSNIPILKIIIKRERPNFLALVSESSYSFPSGHSMISILFFGSIIYLVNKYNIKYKKRPLSHQK